MKKMLWVVALCCVVGLGYALWASGLLNQGGAVSTSGFMTLDTFRCYTVSESMRTVGPIRAKRKQVQVQRIERLLEKATLNAMDQAKLKSERAVLKWDIATSTFQAACAEAYFEPGRLVLRTSFPKVPSQMRKAEARKAFQEALAEVEPRLMPHGFEVRARAHLAEAAFAAGEYEEAMRQALEFLEKNPENLYADELRLVLADASLELGDVKQALEQYEKVGRLKIGFDAHYARYRTGQILLAQDKPEGSRLMKEVVTWAERGERDALLRVLSKTAPIPPAPTSGG